MPAVLPWLRAVVGASLVLLARALSTSALASRRWTPADGRSRRPGTARPLPGAQGRLALVDRTAERRHRRRARIGQQHPQPAPDRRRANGSSSRRPPSAAARRRAGARSSAVPAPRSVEIVPAAGPTATPVIYVLKRGDNLGAVARKYKVTVRRARRSQRHPQPEPCDRRAAARHPDCSRAGLCDHDRRSDDDGGDSGGRHGPRRRRPLPGGRRRHADAPCDHDLRRRRPPCPLRRPAAALLSPRRQLTPEQLARLPRSC